MTGRRGCPGRLAGTPLLARFSPARFCPTHFFPTHFFPLVVPALLVTTAVFAAPANRSAKADGEDLRELRGRIETLRGDIASKEETRSEARDALRESERAISEANRKLRSLAEEQQAAKAELARIGADEARMAAELAARQDIIGRVLMARYLGGEADYFKLLLTGKDPNETTRNLHYYTYISRAQAALVRTQRQNLERLRELEGQARDKNRELAGIEADRKTERDRLAKEQAGRRHALDKVSAEIRDKKQRMKTLERDETRLTRLVEELSKVLAEKAARDAKAREAKAAAPGPRERPRDKAVANVPESAVVSTAAGGGDVATAASPFDRLKGSLRLPVRGELANRFGSPRSDGGPSWKGLFIRAPAGQEVRAVAGGRVVFAEWMRGFGNLLILDHGRGYLSIYGNNESVLRQVGDVVKAGEAVATTGASGGNTDSGLYFELRHEGQAFDPLKWVTLK